ncbi:MAG: hypothetical protein ABIW94_12610 [Gemmatimonadaceae bacterium]
MRRFTLAVVVATIAAAVIVHRFVTEPTYYGDFSLVWFGARSLLNGVDPYQLVGPGLTFTLDYSLLYPGTAFVAAMPLAALPQPAAVTAFVWISTALLVYGMTADSWHRLPILVSLTFLLNVTAAQWTILMTAAVYIPALCFFILVKPQSGVPIVASASTPRAWIALATGVLVLVTVSLLLLPTWPQEWFALVSQRSGHMQAPILRLGGPLIALVLMRWRRREAWLVFTMACMPQTWDWYNVLPLLTVAATYREAYVLSLVSTVGGFIAVYLAMHIHSQNELLRVGGATMVVFAYLPAVVAVLRQPTETEMPWWLSYFKNQSKQWLTRSIIQAGRGRAP